VGLKNDHHLEDTRWQDPGGRANSSSAWSRAAAREASRSYEVAMREYLARPAEAQKTGISTPGAPISMAGETFVDTNVWSDRDVSEGEKHQKARPDVHLK
jgi:hypothetical protein